LWRWGRIAFSGVLAVNAMAVALAVNTSPDGQSDPQAIRWGLLAATLVVGGLTGLPLVAGAWKALKERRLAVELLFVITLAGAFGVSVQSLWRGTGPVYFEVVCLLLVVYAFGAELNRAARNRATEAVKAISASQRKARIRREEGGCAEVRASEVRRGDVVEVLPGEMVPVDGILLHGDALVEESTIRGEFLPQRRRAGERVLAGSFVVDTQVWVEAEAGAGASSLDGIACEIERELEGRAPSEQAADRLARWFVPVVSAVAALSFAGWSLVVPWPDALFHAMAVLLVACPCALGFATPLALWTAASRLQAIGLRVTRVAEVEALAGADTVAFDKTGTLSLAEARVEDLRWAAHLPYQPEELWELVRAAERGLSHPYARALSAENLRGNGQEGGPEASGQDDGGWRREGLRILSGKGIQADLVHPSGRRHEVLIAGRAAAFDGDSGDPALLAEMQRSDEPGIVVRVDGKLAGWARLGEDFREGHGAAMEALERLGMEVWLLSGDSESRTAKAGIARSRGGQSAAAKRDTISALRAQGKRVLFVGDGINDAAAMIAADVAIAVHDGSPMAQASAGLVWDGKDLAAIPMAIRIAKQTVRRVHANFRWAIGYNAVGMALAAAGWLHPVTAALLMVASSTQVTWRAMALLDDLADSPGEEWEAAKQGRRPGRPNAPAVQWSEP
jgi:heavy metal translocating P-type ATPase